MMDQPACGPHPLPAYGFRGLSKTDMVTARGGPETEQSGTERKRGGKTVGPPTGGQLSRQARRVFPLLSSANHFRSQVEDK